MYKLIPYSPTEPLKMLDCSSLSAAMYPLSNRQWGRIGWISSLLTCKLSFCRSCNQWWSGLQLRKQTLSEKSQKTSFGSQHRSIPPACLKANICKHSQMTEWYTALWSCIKSVSSSKLDQIQRLYLAWNECKLSQSITGRALLEEKLEYQENTLSHILMKTWFPCSAANFEWYGQQKPY